MVAVFIICAIQFLLFDCLIDCISQALWASIHSCVIGWQKWKVSSGLDMRQN